MKKSRAMEILKNVWMAAVLAGALYFIYSYREAFLHYLETLSPARMLACLGLLMAGRLALVLTSWLSLSSLDQPLPFPRLFAILSQTQLGKYLPGGIWHIVGQFGMYRASRLSNRISGKAMLLENIWTVAGALFAGVIAAAVSGQQPAWLPAPWIPAAAGAALLLWPVSTLVSVAVLAPQARGRLRLTLQVTGLQAAAWAVMGLSFGILTPAFHGAGLAWGASGFALAWVAGYVFILAPGGVGVREVVLSAFFASFLPAGELAVLVIVHRVIWTAAEVLLAGAGWVIDRRIPLSEAASSTAGENRL